MQNSVTTHGAFRVTAESGLKRWLIEGVVIVASILLAFAIDAWWQKRTDTEAEAVLIASIVQDIERTSSEIERVLARNKNHAAVVRRFVSATPEDLRSLTDEHLANKFFDEQGNQRRYPKTWILGSLLGITTFTPHIASMSDISLSKISDAQIRNSIGNWLVLVVDAHENSPLLMEKGNDLKEDAAIYGAAQLMAQDRGTISAVADAVTHGEVYAAMRSSDQLVAKILRYHNQRDNGNRKIERLAEATDQLLRELKSDLNAR